MAKTGGRQGQETFFYLALYDNIIKKLSKSIIRYQGVMVDNLTA